MGGSADLPVGNRSHLQLEEIMASKKKSPRTRSKRLGKPKRRRRSVSPRVPIAEAKALDAIGERLDMMLPEFIARIAALEHVLVEKQVCAHHDLVRARQFVDEQERS